MVVGLFSAASSVGQLIFLPSLVRRSSRRRLADRRSGRWPSRSSSWPCRSLLLCATGRPTSAASRYGDDGSAAAAGAERAEAAHGATLAPRRPGRATSGSSPASFFVCGYTSNGLIGTHLIPHAVEHGFTRGDRRERRRPDGDDERRRDARPAAGSPIAMTTAGCSAAYYGFRALSIACPAGHPGGARGCSSSRSSTASTGSRRCHRRPT